MKAIETPIRTCFSLEGMEGSYYHEYEETNKNPHSFHKYDKNGRYVIGSSGSDFEKLGNRNDYFISDVFGNRM